MLMLAGVTALSLLGVAWGSPQPPTPQPLTTEPFELGTATWPPDIFPGEDCLSYDGSKVPNCADFVDPVTKQPYYHEHSANCSRFWECGPELETCLVECATCCRLDEQPTTKCNPLCKDKHDQQFHWALTFDERFHHWPEGPTCVWPKMYEGNCTNIPKPCDCHPWQVCINEHCSPQCLEDPHCPDGYKCDDCHWCVPDDTGCHNTNEECEGWDAVCKIPDHENCFYCDGNDCKPGCIDNKNCPVLHPICGHNGKEHRCGCEKNEDCPKDHQCNDGDCEPIPIDCNGENTKCDGWDEICHIPEHDNCHWCNGHQCDDGCATHDNCPQDTHPKCNDQHRCWCEKHDDCPPHTLCTDHECKPGCKAPGVGCGNCAEMCDIPNHKNCHYCDEANQKCAEGCCDDDNCPEDHPKCGGGGADRRCGCDEDGDCKTGYICDKDDSDGDGDDHECIPDDGCNNTDELCPGFNETCTKPPPNHEQCFYCDGKDCKPGCHDSDLNCPPDTYPVCGHGGGDGEQKNHTCGCTADSDCPGARECKIDEHRCYAKPGSKLIDSINIYTADCSGCDDSEGVKMVLLGSTNVDNLDGIPCHTQKLNHPGIYDFDTGGSAVFDGHNDNGSVDEEEKDQMGGCYQGPLDAKLTDGGNVTWEGAGTWSPQHEGGVCVDWVGHKEFAWSCDVSGSGPWSLDNCKELKPLVVCPK